MGICDSLCINSIAIRAISCCFVIAMRADLREEFDMADEAFALSPISARATLPGEEDYAAIAEAFMETSRGRWFLTEYAKRNRNADTRMVLDAVARIEQSLTAQREETLEREASLQREEGLSAQQAAEAVAAAAAAQERLTEALAAIRSSVEAAEESAVEALDSLALEQRLAPVRKGARVLREIAWRLREIGNDGRICDLIDSQVTVIEKGTDQFSSEEARAGLRAAFAALQGRLVEFVDDDRSFVPAAETEAAAPFPAAPQMAPGGGDRRISFGTGSCRSSVRFAGQARRDRVRSGGSRADATGNAAGRRGRCSGGSHRAASRCRVRRARRRRRPGRRGPRHDRDGDGRAGPDQRRRDRRSDCRASPSSGACAVVPAIVAKAPEPVAAPAAATAGSTGGSTSAAARTGPHRRWKCRSARASSRAACCESRSQRPTTRWRRSGA